MKSGYHAHVGALAAVVLMLALGGCAARFSADVTRFHELPAPAGETLQIVAKDPAKADTLEFQRYADLVGEALGRQGYRPPLAGEPSVLIAAIDYGVSQGRQALRDNGGSRVGVGVGGGSHHVGVGVSTTFALSGGDGDMVYTRRLSVEISRRSDGKRLFEGRAISEGRTPDLGAVMPLLVEALFTDFPGVSGTTQEVELDAPRDGS